VTPKNKDLNEITQEVGSSITEEPPVDIKTPTSKIMYKIQDADGYSNMRDLNGEIIKKVYENEQFEVIGSSGKQKKVKLADGTVGFIHESRVAKAD